MTSRDMSNIYRFRSTSDLRKLRSQKITTLQRLSALPTSYWAEQDKNRTAHLIDLIDAELACRRNQLRSIQ